MKNIDEAIAHAREVAENSRKESNNDAFSLDYMNEMHKKNCVKCAEEHDQLAEWLEELKEARKGFEENRKAGYKHGYSDGYKKAIDEFADKMIIMMPGHKADILLIAEQLKGGAV